MIKTLFILMIWTQLGGNSSAPNGWVVVGHFRGAETCATAARQIQAAPDRPDRPADGKVKPHLCLDTGIYSPAP